MSSQDNKGIPLSHAPDGLGYKLLELPPELVSLLEGENPPMLTLESSETAAVLKTAQKTYSLRQNNTSNALILLSPASLAPPLSQILETGLTTVAIVHETIDLVPEGSEAAASQLAQGKWHEKFGKSR